MYLLYSTLAAVALLLTAPLWLIRILRHGKYRAGLGERFGRVPQRLRDPQRRPTIWVHAVSVGELLAVSGLIAELQRRAPAYRIAISTTTATGQKLARERFGQQNAFYFPADFAFAVRPYLRALRPELVVIAETEFWPNFLRLDRKSVV
jgi:3-deoxy-D-manno-octulosonic-acid transferase